MNTAKIFKCGNSQALRIPKQFQFHCETVEIFKRDGELVIREVPRTLAKAFEVLSKFPDDFYSQGRKDTLPQKRDFFE